MNKNECKMKYQIRYIVQKSNDGVSWEDVADCICEEEALEEIKELKERSIKCQ